jgi:hypothetical protein
MTERLRSVADAPVVRAESLTKRFDDVIEGTIGRILDIVCDGD